MEDPSLAYVLWYFPKLSETFVIEELLALGRQGIHPLIFARERPREQITNPAAAALLERTVWLDDLPRARRVAAAARAAGRRPLRAVALLALVLRSRSRIVARNVWAGAVLADHLRRAGVRYAHAHFAGNAGQTAYAAARLAGIPYGVTVHAVELYVGRLLCRVVGGASLRVTVCRYNVDQLLARCASLEPSSIVVKYAGLDTDRFRLDAPRPERPGRLVVAIGRLTPKKGFLVLLDAVARLREGGREVRCVIVGDGPQERLLRARIAELGLDDVVELRGDQAPARVAELLAEADVLAAPCTIAPWGDRDSMPVTIKEAMAMELPVVATADFGIPEMVPPDAGVLVPRDDPAALADAIDAVLGRSAAERAAMGRAGRAAVVERFAEDVCVRAIVPHLRRLAAG